MIRRRIAIVLATLGMTASCVFGMILGGIIARTRWQIAIWLLVPFSLATVVFGQILRDAEVVAVWLPLGALVGFVLLTVISIGAAFVWGAFLLLIAAVVQLSSSRSPLRTLVALVSLLVGATGMSAMFLINDLVRQAQTGRIITHAPVVAVGSLFFPVMLMIAWFTKKAVAFRKTARDLEIMVPVMSRRGGTSEAEGSPDGDVRSAP